MRQWKLNKITGPLFSIVLVLLIGVVIMLVVGGQFAAVQKGSFISLPSVSKFWMYLPVPVAGGAMIIFEIESLYNNIKKFFIQGEKEVQA